jgi:hypothetical protein
MQSEYIKMEIHVSRYIQICAEQSYCTVDVEDTYRCYVGLFIKNDVRSSVGSFPFKFALSLFLSFAIRKSLMGVLGERLVDTK